MLSLYLAVLDDQSKEEQFIDVYNTYKRLVYHTAYKIMGDSYLAEDVLQEVFLYIGLFLRQFKFHSVPKIFCQDTFQTECFLLR